jgi:hypothetical protein
MLWNDLRHGKWIYIYIYIKKTGHWQRHSVLFTVIGSCTQTKMATNIPQEAKYILVFAKLNSVVCEFKWLYTKSKMCPNITDHSSLVQAVWRHRYTDTSEGSWDAIIYADIVQVARQTLDTMNLINTCSLCLLCQYLVNKTTGTVFILCERPTCVSSKKLWMVYILHSVHLCGRKKEGKLSQQMDLHRWDSFPSEQQAQDIQSNYVEHIKSTYYVQTEI